MNEETVIQRKIQDYLNKRRIFNWRESDSKESGRPDLVACYKGFFIGLEIKTPTGKPTELQKTILSLINKAGGFGILATSVQDVEDLLRKIDLEDAWRR